MQPSTPVNIQTTYDEVLNIERTKDLLVVVTNERDKAKDDIKTLLAELDAINLRLEELKSLVIFFTNENYLLIETTNHARFRELLGIQVFEEGL